MYSRRLLLFLLMSTIGLAACDRQVTSDITFDHAYQGWTQMYQADIDQDLLVQTLEGTRKSTSSLHVQTQDMAQTGGILDIQTSMIADQSTQSSSGDIQLGMIASTADLALTGNLGLQLSQTLSGSIPLMYFMIDEFTLDSTDPQMAFLSMMVEGFRDQRIMVDSAMTGTNVSMPDTTAQVKTILTNLQMTLNQLDSYNLLQNMGQTTYEGDIAFAVITNTDALEQAITDIITGTVFNEEWEGIQGMPALSGYLIVHTADDYELLLTHEMTTISLQRDMMQIVAKQDGNQLIITLTRNTKHTAELSILVTQAEQTTLEGHVVFDNQMTKDLIQSTYDGMITLYGPMIQQFFSKETVDITLQGTSSSQRQDEGSFMRAPPINATSLSTLTQGIMGGDSMILDETNDR